MFVLVEHAITLSTMTSSVAASGRLWSSTRTLISSEVSRVTSKHILLTFPRGTYSGMRTSDHRMRLLSLNSHAERLAGGVKHLLLTKTAGGVPVGDSPPAEDNRLASEEEQELRNVFTEAIIDALRVGIPKYAIDVEGKTVSDLPESMRVFTTKDAVRGVGTDASAGVALDKVSELKCVVLVIRTDADDASGAHITSSADGPTLPCTSDSSHVRLKMLTHIGPIDAHPPTAHVEVRGTPRSDPRIKDSLWVSDRERFERLKAPGVNEVLLCQRTPVESPTVLSGRVTEGLLSNFFAISEDGNVLITAPADEVLPGTIRELVLEACGEHEVPVRLESPALEDLPAWAGAAVASTTRLLLPIHRIDIYMPDAEANTLPAYTRDFDPAIPPLLERLCDWTSRSVISHSTQIFDKLP